MLNFGQARFNNPRGLVVDSDGSLLVADMNNNRVRRIAADGTTSTLAGTFACLYVIGVVLITA